MRHVAATDPDLPVPRTVPAGGEDIVTITDDDGRACLARLITTVPGEQLEGQVVTADVAEQVGAATARTAQALRGFFHPCRRPAACSTGTYAPSRASRRGGGLTADDPLHPVVDRVAAVLPRLLALPSGIHHADVTLTNLLATDGRITGVIDFGDLHYTADVADLAVALTSVLRNTSDTQVSSPWELAGATLRGYQRLRPLSHDEVEVLGELVLSRLVLSTIISRGRAAAHPDNTAYITQYDDANARTTTELARLSPRELAERLHRLAGTRAAAPGRRRRRTAAPRRWAAPSRRCSTTSRCRSSAARAPWLIGRRRTALPRRLQQRRRRRARRPDGRRSASAGSWAGSTPTRATSTPRSSSSPSGSRRRCRTGSTPSCSPPRAPRPTSWPGGSRPSGPAAPAR